MELIKAQKLAEKIVAELAPFCAVREDGRPWIEIAGSIRRLRPNVNDIDLVCVPRDYAGLRSRVLERCRLKVDTTQTIIAELPNKFQLDIWLAHAGKKELFHQVPGNFGSLFLCRTGSREFNIWLCRQAQRHQYHWDQPKGLMIEPDRAVCVASATEADIFKALDLEFIKPEDRER